MLSGPRRIFYRKKLEEIPETQFDTALVCSSAFKAVRRIFRIWPHKRRTTNLGSEYRYFSACNRSRILFRASAERFCGTASVK